SLLPASSSLLLCRVRGCAEYTDGSHIFSKEREAMGPLGVWELVVIFVVALIVFGPRKLPELGRSLGKSLSEFKRASNELRSTLDDEIRMEERRQATARAASTPATPPPATEPAATSAPDAEAAFDAAESGAEPETVARESRA